MHDHDDQPTTTKSWSEIKRGDVIFFGTGWYAVDHASLAGPTTAVVRLVIRGPKAPTFFETHRVRTDNGPALCRA